MTEVVFVKLKQPNAAEIFEETKLASPKNKTADIFQKAGATVTQVQGDVLRLELDKFDYRTIRTAPNVANVSISLRGLNP